MSSGKFKITIIWPEHAAEHTKSNCVEHFEDIQAFELRHGILSFIHSGEFLIFGGLPFVIASKDKCAE